MELVPNFYLSQRLIGKRGVWSLTGSELMFIFHRQVKNFLRRLFPPAQSGVRELSFVPPGLNKGIKTAQHLHLLNSLLFKSPSQ